jgi:hypothetical protein
VMPASGAPSTQIIIPTGAQHSSIIRTAPRNGHSAGRQEAVGVSSEEDGHRTRFDESCDSLQTQHSVLLVIQIAVRYRGRHPANTRRNGSVASTAQHVRGK